MYDRILVPTDGSDVADAAAKAAIGLAQRFDAELHVIHVVDTGLVWGELESGAVLDVLEDAGRRALEQVIDRAEKTGLSTVESSVLSGTPYGAIVDYAETADIDCVVWGRTAELGGTDIYSAA